MATCIHGFEPGQCLICQTLGSEPGSGSEAGSGRRRAATKADRRANAPTNHLSGGPVEVVGDRTRSVASRTGSHIAIALIAVVLAVIAFWIVAGVVFALLRLLEIVIVAAVAGVLGYRLGRARGRSGH